MSLDKAIEHGKEKRKPYRGAKAIDCTCRNHGSCPWCVENRTHRFRDKEGENAMRVEKTYYAFDETEFDDEGSCIAYENRVLALWDSVDTFDSEFNLGEKGSETALEDAYYIVVKDEENAKSFIQWVNSVYGFNFPDEDIVEGNGIIYFDEDRSAWVNLTKHYEELGEKLASIRKAVGGS